MPEPAMSELVNRIRDFINSARKQHALLKDSKAWNQLCSSLDAIGDTELAFDAYDGASTTAADPGATYILVYGVIQALVLQQDAVKNLAEALDLPYKQDDLLRDIREIRNASVGHPTKRSGKPRSHFISRITMSKAGFQLLTVYPDHRPAEFKAISLPKLIATQQSQLRAILTQVVNSLEKEDAEHKVMFRDTKLASAFTTTTDYYFEKLYEAVHGRHPEFGHLHLKLLVEAIECFKAMLAERDLAGAIDSIEYHLDHIGYPPRTTRHVFRCTLYIQAHRTRRIYLRAFRKTRV